MNEDNHVQAGPVVKVARDLSEIVELHARLRTQAVAQGDNAEMPGGAAMVALGNVANIEAWENQHQATERHAAGLDGYRQAYTSVEDEDPDEAWSAYQLLEFWSEAWRAEHGAEYEMRRTIATEANFIKHLLDWAWDNLPEWDDFAADINRARVQLENILSAGNRFERSRIVCNQCDAQPRLLALRGVADDGSDDRWKCPACKHRYDPAGAHRAHAAMLRSEGAERWVPQADAIATLKAQGRPERTIRAWLSEGEGGAYCDPVSHQVWVWWPELWTRHRETPVRKRGKVIA